MKFTVLDCLKVTLPKRFHWSDCLLLFAKASIIWFLAVNEICFAQQHPNQKSGDLQLGDLLPVPQSPKSREQSKSGLQTLPPPPEDSRASTTSLIPNMATSKDMISLEAQQIPERDIKQLENGFLHREMTGKAPQAQTRTIRKNAERNTGQLHAQSPPLLPLPSTNTTTTSTQEFTAPSTPTFHQLLNSQAQSVPLPPIRATPAPSFNAQQVQLTSPSSPSTPVSTFNILLNCQAVPSPSVANTPSSSFNILLNCQPVSPQSITGASTSSIYPVPNYQGGIQQLPGYPISTQTQKQELPITPVPSQPPTATPPVTSQSLNQPRSPIDSAAFNASSLKLQGVYITEGDDSAARARLSGTYPLSSQALIGATLDLVTGEDLLVDSRGDGLNINELYVATSFGGVPNLRVVLGQIDLTSYFDRNSFAKDGASQFFNPVFQTNPALSATGIASRTGFLVNWSVTDNIEAKAAVFSSSNKISDFSLDGFAGEVAIRYGNAIIRGTYASDRDAGNRDTFPESFGIARNQANTLFGTQEDDREEAYGLNAEVYIPNLKMGVFGRYGRYENRDLGEGADTYSFGVTFLDLFTPDDRLGLGYGRGLSNDRLRRGDTPDVLELFYDFRVLPNLWLGFTLQERDNFEEAVLGVRVRSELDLVAPRRRNTE
ncbi:porin [Scytonema hofmannii PCC 7110]|uniref:Porin n=1 Tax=Scytonema hofmannii PCC 7110 TaxID=128403 RepID=A0A139WU76_9CYAN|nr:carbohydrate porin [Scytonema hofmannii]KYC35981.1 porin [Scytonema hofmannii PCC 7110]